MFRIIEKTQYGKKIICGWRNKMKDNYLYLLYRNFKLKSSKVNKEYHITILRYYKTLQFIYK